MKDPNGAATLRLELKKWETTFASANAGRKPGRDDIKNDAVIAAKYKEYQQLRRADEQAQCTPSKRARSTVERHDDDGRRPRQSVEHLNTPRANARTSTLAPPPAPEPISEPEPTPAFVRIGLGPTPQKDGAVLGIFDTLLSETPSKRTTSPIATTNNPSLITATPSKKATSAAPSSSAPELSRTPQSSSKRFYLDAFAGTPLKRKRTEDEDDEEAQHEHLYTPNTNASKRSFTTPSFLRRFVPSFTSVAEDDENDKENPRIKASHKQPFGKKRGLVRSLSTLIQGLRKQEDDRLDDELAVLQELEAEDFPSVGEARVPPKVLVEDSQVVGGEEMPLGPDQAEVSSEEDAGMDRGALDANGNPRKVWKKKGLKRQTRRVVMRPVLHQPRKEREVVADDEVNKNGENRQDRNSVIGDEENEKDGEGAERGSDDDFIGEGELDEQTDKSLTSKATKAREKKNRNAEQKKKKPVNALAHANFRKLKIKNKNSKAKGRGGRFGRR